MRKTSVITLSILAILALSALATKPAAAVSAVDGGRITWQVDAPSYDPKRVFACSQMTLAGDPARGGISMTGNGLDVKCVIQDFDTIVSNDLAGPEAYSSVILGYLFTAPVDTYLYDVFSGSNIAIPDGNNWLHVNDPALNTLVQNFRFGSGTLSDAVGNSTLTEAYNFQHGYWFPLYVPNQNFAANNQTYTGYINWPGYGTQNPFWELQNIHRTDGVTGNNATRPLTVGMLSDISGVNPLDSTANSVWSAAVYNEVFDSLMAVNPHTQTLQPWIATVTDGACTDIMHPGCGPTGHFYDFHLFSNVTFSDGITMNATDVDWTAKLLQCQFKVPCTPAPLTASAFQHYVGDNINSQFDITFFYNATSYFGLYDANMPVYAKHVWSAIPAFMSNPATYEPNTNSTIATFMTGTGPFKFTSWVKGSAVTVTKRAGYYYSDPTSTNNYGGFIDTLSSLFGPNFMYHGAWVNSIVFSVGLGGTDTKLAQNLYTPNARNPSIDFAPWPIPAAETANVQNNVATPGRGYQFTSHGEFGLFFYGVNVNQGVPHNTYVAPAGADSSFNPFGNTWTTSTGGSVDIGSMFRFALNRMIDRNGIVTGPCGGQCVPLLGVVSPSFGSFHNSTLDYSNAVALNANFLPHKMNDTLTTMASLGVAFLDTADGSGFWHYYKAVVPPTPVFGNFLALLPLLGASAALLARKYKRV